MTDRSYLLSLQVRIFPYLIGRESAFAENLKWMACANKGGASNTCMDHWNMLFFIISPALCVCVCGHRCHSAQNTLLQVLFLSMVGDRDSLAPCPHAAVDKTNELSTVSVYVCVCE